MSNDLLGNTKKYEVSPIVALRGQKRMGYTPDRVGPDEGAKRPVCRSQYN